MKIEEKIKEIDIEKFKIYYSKHSNKETEKEYNLSSYYLLLVLKNLDIIPHSKAESIKLYCLNTYGVDNPSKIQSNIEKIKQTKLERYGTENYNNAKQIKETCLQRYGTPSASGNQEIQEKIKNTNKDRYGVENIFQDTKYIKEKLVEKYGSYEKYIKDKQEKIKKTIKERYGVDNISQCKENRIKAMAKMKETVRERYGLDYTVLLPQVKYRNGYSINTKPNLNFAKMLEKNNIEYTQEFNLVKYSYDFKVGNNLIEINPWNTHNSTINSPFNPKPKDYHSKKTETAKENGYRCIHIWDWDDKNKIIRLIGSKRKIYARLCNIKEIDKTECKTFIEENHLQGYARDEIRIGLYNNGALVSVMTFGKPRYNKKYDYELIRYCSSCNVIGGAEKLYKYFVRTYNPKSVISYCDLSKFNGDTYIKLGFTLKKKSIGKHWYNYKTKRHITDNLLRQRGFDQLLGSEYGIYGKGTSNEKLMKEHNFVEIYDAGQATYIWEKKS